MQNFTKKNFVKNFSEFTSVFQSISPHAESHSALGVPPSTRRYTGVAIATQPRPILYTLLEWSPYCSLLRASQTGKLRIRRSDAPPTEPPSGSEEDQLSKLRWCLLRVLDSDGIYLS